MFYSPIFVENFMVVQWLFHGRNSQPFHVVFTKYVGGMVCHWLFRNIFLQFFHARPTVTSHISLICSTIYSSKWPKRCSHIWKKNEADGIQWTIKGAIKSHSNVHWSETLTEAFPKHFLKKYLKWLCFDHFAHGEVILLCNGILK